MTTDKTCPARIGVFGGTFNPIHLGHQHLIQNALQELRLDRILLIPTYLPPHKIARDLATGEDRLNMCRIVAQSDARIVVSDLEMQRQGSSYTWLTLKELNRQYPGAELFLIVGGDMLRTFHQWRRWRDILRMAKLCAAPREMDELAELVSVSGRYVEIGRGCMVMDTPVVEISSTQIRSALKKEKSAGGLLHPGVEEYCRQHGLYQEE